MISLKVIVFVIANFCEIKSNKDLDNLIKSDCLDHMVNCVVIYNNETTELMVDECKESWAKREVDIRKELKRKRDE